MRKNSILTGSLTIFGIALWCGFSVPVAAQSPKKPSAPSATGKKPAPSVKKSGVATPDAGKSGTVSKSAAGPKGTSVKTGKSPSSASKPLVKAAPASKASAPAKTVAKSKSGEKSKSDGEGAKKSVAKAKPTKTPLEKSTAKPLASRKDASKKSGASGAGSAASKAKPAVARREGDDDRGSRTPSPPATLSKGGKTAARATSPRSVAEGSEVKASLKPGTAKPPFTSEDDEREPEGATPATDDFDLEKIEVQGTGEVPGEPVPSAIERVAQSETPMMLVLGLAGGAGAAAWNGELPNRGGRGVGVAAPSAAPTAGPQEGSEAVPSDASAIQPSKGAPPEEIATPRAVAVPPEPVAAAQPARVDLPIVEVLPSSALAESSQPIAAAPIPSASPLATITDPVPAQDVAESATEGQPESGPLAEPEAEAMPVVTEAASSPPAEVPPAAAVTAMPAEEVQSAVTEVAQATVNAKIAPEAASPGGAPAAPATVAPVAPISDLAELAGLANALQPLPVPSARAIAVESAGRSVPAGALRKAKATITSMAQNALPTLPEGDAHVVATSLMQALPASAEEERDTPHETPADPVDETPRQPSDSTGMAAAPTRLGQPSAPDELKPQRADRSGSAFEVPAAAGDLLIAAISQTDFQVDEKRVVFKGDVIMKNERFYLTADTLIAYMKDNQSGLEFAEAQGNVIVRMVENGRETGSYGHSKTAVFHPETGEIVLKGWPQLRMGNKAHVASSATTEMSLFTDGRMKTSGRNQTMIVP